MNKDIEAKINLALTTANFSDHTCTWYTSMEIDTQVKLGSKYAIVKHCRNCGHKGAYVEYNVGDLPGLRTDVRRFIHVEFTHAETKTTTILHMCSLNPVTGNWDTYINPVFSDKCNTQ
jgi:hypothetical protein